MASNPNPAAAWLAGGGSPAVHPEGAQPPPGVHRGPGNTWVETFIPPETLAYDAARAAEVAAAIAAQDARAAELERQAAQLAPYETRDPPDSAELGLIISDLSLPRQALARMNAWIERERTELTSMRQGRDACLAQIGIPADLEAQIEDIERTDRTGFVAWLRGGGTGTAPSVREFQRETLRRRLDEDTHAAAVARDSLAQIDVDIEAKERGVAVLERRQPSYVHAVLIEASSGLRERHERALASLTDVLADELALASLAGAVTDDLNWRFHSGPTTYRAELPHLRWPGHKCAAEHAPVLAVTEETVRSRVADLQAACDVLMKDATAKIRIPGGRR